MQKYELLPIGVINTPFDQPSGTPIQSAGSSVDGQAVILPQFQAGLADVDGFSHIILIYAFNRSQGYSLTVTPFLDTTPRGVFATRAPKRPNPIGISVVRVNKVQDGVIYFSGADMLNGTPLLDIKPWVPAFDKPEQVKQGWLEQRVDNMDKTKADNRFE